MPANCFLKFVVACVRNLKAVTLHSFDGLLLLFCESRILLVLVACFWIQSVQYVI